MNAMIPAIRVLFALSVMGMVWWAFLWRFVVAADPDSPIFHRGSIATLLLFCGCIVLLLSMRLRARGHGGH